MEQFGVSNYRGILLPQCLRLAEFGGNFFGFRLLGLTSYMLDHKLPLFTCGLSLFHGWLPLHVYGFNDQQPQTWVNQDLYIILWLGVLWLVAFLPTHLALRKIFPAPPPATGLKSPSGFFDHPSRLARAGFINVG